MMQCKNEITTIKKQKIDVRLNLIEHQLSVIISILEKSRYMEVKELSLSVDLWDSYYEKILKNQNQK